MTIPWKTIAIAAAVAYGVVFAYSRGQLPGTTAPMPMAPTAPTTART